METVGIIVLAGLCLALHRKNARISAALFRSQSHAPELKTTIRLLTEELEDTRHAVRHLVEERDCWARESRRVELARLN